MLVRPVWPLDPVRPAAPEPSRARRPARTKKKGPAARTASRKGRKSREYWIGVLAEEIRRAEAAGGTWEPVYDGPGGLRARTGYERSWCEKAVRAAKKAAQSPAAPRTGEPLERADTNGT
ncbi:hypothetical protein ACFOY4_04960 [Actinomadura syzygii]|uniref:Uncharacterized protein n=1 Tax=Actinomadura syzygii TaxID=1427538 RepID=A0A5D0TVZ8_9ACTN|nr:hypothetical protein [Actinomadura syzygii]TYC10037.1 hypothetical protein FXF65_33630 [Actinomadura syzygii]